MSTGQVSGLAVVVGRFRQVLGRPGVLRFFVPAAVARLGVAMAGLAVLWAVHGMVGSFGQVGAATGAFAIADAVLGPQVARLVDRWGQRRVVTVTTTVFAAAGAGLALGCAWSWPVVVVIVLAGVAGGTAPPVGALSSARWRRSLPEAEGIAAALSLEGALNDLTFLVGPVLVTVLSATLVPWSGLVLALVLVATGMIGLLTARASEPPPSRSMQGLLLDARLLNRRFVALFIANLALGFFFGGIGVSITAFAVAHEAEALTGLITAVSGVVSLTAGLAYGGLEKGRPLPVMIVAGSVIAGGTALLALVSSVAVMFLGYAVVGGCVALVLVPASVLLQQVAPGDIHTQAMTWINSASAAGIAIAAPLVGHVIHGHGWSAGFLVLAGLTVALPVTLLLARPILTTVQHESGNTQGARMRCSAHSGST